MALKFYPLKVQNVVQETGDAISIVFDIPGELKEAFKYKPGQYLTLQLTIDGNRYRRAYSLSSSPLTEDEVKITTKRVEGGIVSNYLNDHAKPGMEIEVLPPMGHFVPELDERNENNYIFFSGGSGITPVISILKSVLKHEPLSRAWLFYGNRNQESIIFHRELKALKEAYGDRLTLVHVLEEGGGDDWDGFKGRMDREKVDRFLKGHCKDVYAHAQYYICGPNAMMQEVKLALQNQLVPDNNIHIERFTSDLDLADEEAKTEQREAAQQDSGGELRFPVKAKILLDGNEYEIEVGEDETVLEAAIEADLDPPFACQMGVCTTCQAMLREGKVHMDEREALTDEEMEEGYVLTCQSHPLTNRIVVDYDA